MKKVIILSLVLIILVLYVFFDVDFTKLFLGFFLLIIAFFAYTIIYDFLEDIGVIKKIETLDEKTKRINPKKEYSEKEKIIQNFTSAERKSYNKLRKAEQKKYIKSYQEKSTSKKMFWERDINEIRKSNLKKSDAIEKINDSKLKTKNVVHQIFTNLKGVDLGNVQFGLDRKTPEKTFTSDIDGSWYYYKSNQMGMIFKAFSKEKFDKELVKILDNNKIISKDFLQENGYKSWKGDGFQIEHSLIGGIDLIVITNEAWVPEGYDKLKTTNLVPEVNLPTGYEKIGIKHIYDGESFLNATKRTFLVNIPLLFKDPKDNLHYILIRIQTLTLAKKIIDDIIEKNYGKNYFTKAEDKNGYEYMFYNNLFSIGYQNREFVRINMLHSLRSLSDDGFEMEHEKENDTLDVKPSKEEELTKNEEIKFIKELSHLSELDQNRMLLNSGLITQDEYDDRYTKYYTKQFIDADAKRRKLEENKKKSKNNKN